jgi:hypothetical protein
MKIVDDGVPDIFVNGPVTVATQDDLVFLTAFTTRPAVTYGQPVVLSETDASVVARLVIKRAVFEDLIAASHAMLASK